MLTVQTNLIISRASGVGLIAIITLSGKKKCEVSGVPDLKHSGKNDYKEVVTVVLSEKEQQS